MKKACCRVCDTPYDVSEDIPSLPHLRRYFVLIRSAYLHWPENHPTQFADEIECRKWLQMKAGHYEIPMRVPLTGMPRERVIEVVTSALRACDDYAIPRLIEGDMVIFKPLSIALYKMQHKARVALVSAVEEIIETETGMKIEELMAHANQV